MSNQQQRVYSAGGVSGHCVFEQCLGLDGAMGYAVFDNKGQISFSPTFRDPDDQQEYQPLNAPPWPLTQFPENPENMKSLMPLDIFNTVRGFVYESVELPHETLYDVVTLWIMSSHLLEEFVSVPYIAFNGPRDSGKTRALEVLAYLSYRAILSPSFSSASLYRLLEKHDLTLCLDEAEIYGSELRAEIIGILNAGYRKGQGVCRVNTDSGQVEIFRCFGFKSFAAINLLAPTIESRSIVINMRRNARDVPLFIDENKASLIRFQLLQYRAKIENNEEQLLQDDAKIFSYLPLKNGRIVELFYPLIKVAPSEEIRQRIGSYAKEVYTNRVEEEKTSTEAELVDVLIDCREFVKGGKLSIKDIVDKYNRGKTERYQWNPKSTGRALQKLGFKSVRISGGFKAIVYDQGTLRYLADRYVPEKTSLISQTSQTSLENLDHKKSDVSEQSDVSPEGYPSIVDLTMVYQKTEEAMEKICDICHKTHVTNWEATTTKKQAVNICENCVQVFKQIRGQ